MKWSKDNNFVIKNFQFLKNSQLAFYFLLWMHYYASNYLMA